MAAAVVGAAGGGRISYWCGTCRRKAGRRVHRTRARRRSCCGTVGAPGLAVVCRAGSGDAALAFSCLHSDGLFFAAEPAALGGPQLPGADEDAAQVLVAADQVPVVGAPVFEGVGTVPPVARLVLGGRYLVAAARRTHH